MTTIGTWELWLGFIGFVILMLALDLFFLGANRPHKMSTKSAVTWSIVWVVLALGFTLLLWIYLNHTEGAAAANSNTMQFFTGYVLEKALAVDNLFVFLLIFKNFAVPLEYQRRVFLYGVIGALVLRGLMIGVGSLLIQEFTWVLYIFGVFLLVTGLKMFWVSDEVKHISEHKLVRFLRKHLRITDEFHKEHFFIKQRGLWYCTPLFLVLVLIEFSDVIFATDSIPAIFAITTDPFIVFSSNVFAIMGLRALYFLLANAMASFYYLQYGLALILTLIGVKLLAANWIHISAGISLGAIALILLSSIGLSLLRKK